MTYVHNYTALKQRDMKIYNVGGYNISGGFSVEFLKVVGPVAIALIIFFVLLAKFVFGLDYVSFSSPNFSATYTIFTLIISIAIACGLWYIQIGGYRLYFYLLAYIKPKKMYRLAFKETPIVFTNIKINAVVHSIL